MRIAYVVAEGLDKEHGVSKKIYNQIKFWIDEGNDVKLFYFSNKILNPMFRNLKVEIISYRNRIDFVLKKNDINSLLTWNPDIVYFRTYLFSRKFFKMLKEVTTIIEINTDDIAESKLNYPPLVRMYHMLTRELIFKNASGFVCVTKELEKKFSIYNKPTTTISNGINRPFLGKEFLKRDLDGRFKVVFLGSPNQKWHGLDKITWLAKKLPEVDFHIVGTIEIENPTSNLIQYGYLNEKDYLNILRQSDVAIGTMALHRKGMEEASPLKTREYLKYGIPLIIGYTDTDLDGKELDFILQLPNENNNIIGNLSRIREFILNSRERKVTIKDIEQIFNDRKEKKRLQFLKTFI